MKPTNATLNAILAGRQFFIADLITFTLQDGTALTYTSAQVDTSFGTPTDTSLVCLLHLDGTNGSTTFTDATGRHTFAVATGSPVLDTSEFEFGTASLKTPSGGGQITSDSNVASADFQMGSNTDYTVDFWFQLDGASGVQNNLVTLDGTSGGQVIYVDSSGHLNWFVTSNVISGATTVTFGVMHHAALVRHSGTETLYLDGVSQGTRSFSGTYTGILGPGGNFPGNGHHIDEVRVTLRAAWTANFTPPTAPYSTTPPVVYPSGGATGPYFDRKDNKSKVVWNLGVGTDTLVMDVLPGSATVLGHSWFDAVRLGLFDGADFEIDRGYSTALGVVQTGCAPMLFKGRVAEVEADRQTITFSINDYRELLNQQMPRWLYAASCQNDLFDASCTLLSTNFQSTGTVGAGSSFSFIINTTLAQASGYFDQGKIKFTSGNNNGLSFPVSSWNLGTQTITLAAQTPFLPVVSDQFTIVPGCDLSTGSGGCSKFSNIANFRGMPYIPDPGQAL